MRAASLYGTKVGCRGQRLGSYDQSPMVRRGVSQNNPRHESDEVVAMSTVRQIVACILVCMLLSPSLPATGQGQEPSRPTFKPEEIDQLVAPIALHPDPLLAQILM